MDIEWLTVDIIDTEIMGTGWARLDIIGPATMGSACFSLKFYRNIQNNRLVLLYNLSVS